MARKVSCVNSAKLVPLYIGKEPKCDIKLYTNVSDFTGNRTVPSMDNSNAARVPLLYCTVPYSKIRVLVLVLQSTIPTVLPY